MIKLWSNFSLHSDTLSTFASSFVQVMSMLRSRKTALDLIQFFCRLQNVVIKSGKCDFNLFRQHNTNEIQIQIYHIQYKCFVYMKNSIWSHLEHKHTYEHIEKSGFLQQLFRSISESGVNLNTPFVSDKFFTIIKEPTGPDSFFCKFCENYEPASIDHQISKVGNYSIFQLKYFLNYRGNFIKNITKVQCIKTLSVPLVYEVAFQKNFNLTATFNHTGSHNIGH